jgi:hypothetical protein
MDLDKLADSLSYSFASQLNLNLSPQSRPFSSLLQSLGLGLLSPLQDLLEFFLSHINHAIYFFNVPILTASSLAV